MAQRCGMAGFESGLVGVAVGLLRVGSRFSGIASVRKRNGSWKVWSGVGHVGIG